MPKSSGDGGHKLKLKKVAAVTQKQKVYRAPNPVIGAVAWGVNHSMMQLAAIPPQPLIMDADFKAYAKIQVHNHGYNCAFLPSKYALKEYCPIVFRDLRERFGVDPDMYLNSIVSESARELEGAKRAKTYATGDNEFLLQTMNKDEVGNFFHGFNAYHAMVVERHAETLLPHYLGLFRVTIHEKDQYVLIQRNVQSYLPEMQRMYDLKGSTVDRDANQKELEKSVPLFKDNDFVSREKTLKLDPTSKSWILSTLQKDAEFLASQKMMDYSLFVGIRDLQDDPNLFQPGRDAFVFAMNQGQASPNSSPMSVRSGGEPADGGADAQQQQAPQAVYLLGIVNVLTRYGAKKIAAHNAKSLRMKGASKAEISTVNPEQYMQRFVKFATTICSS